MQQGNRQELLEGRATSASNSESKLAAAELRQVMARLVKASPNEIALTHHTTDGMNIAVHGLNWQPGDEVVTTTLEHPGGFLPVYVVRQRFGVAVKMIDLPPELGPEEVVARFEAAISPRTRLLVFSHVAWNTGLRLPLAEIVAMAHRHHVLCAVDAAQAAGAIPLDLPASGVDFYAMPGQKWLCGPEGTGALYVRGDDLSLLQPTFVGYRTLGDEGTSNLSGYFLPAANARRYEVGTTYRPGLKAMATNLTWLEETIGWDWIHARIAHLFDYARGALVALPSVTVITPPGPQAGLLTFILQGQDPTRVVEQLEQADIIIRSIGQPNALRLSTGFYNTEADIDRLLAALQGISG